MIKTREIAPADLATVPEVLPAFDYASLPPNVAEQAKGAVAYINDRQRTTAASILEIGERLISVKEALGHGSFTTWLDAEFGWNERTARNYMLAARSLPKSETVSVLPVTTIYELARASEPVRAKVIARMDVSPIPVDAIRQLISEGRAEERQAAVDAKASPEQRAKLRARKARQAREHDAAMKDSARRAAERNQANTRAALALIEAVGASLPQVCDALQGSDWSDLAERLRYPYGVERPKDSGE